MARTRAHKEVLRCFPHPITDVFGFNPSRTTFSLEWHFEIRHAYIMVMLYKYIKNHCDCAVAWAGLVRCVLLVTQIPRCDFWKWWLTQGKVLGKTK